MAVDLSVFGRQKSLLDQQALQAAFDQRKQLMQLQAQAQLQKTAAPSNVQEYQYYTSLPPEAQAQYLNVKRASQVLNLGDTMAVRAPTGGISESYDVGVNPNNAPDLKRQQAVATATGKVQGANQSAVASAPGAVSAFDELLNAADSAPSGKVDSLLAGVANSYPTFSTEGTRKDALGQGAFGVKRGAAENEIRSTFRIAGSGTQTDADAKPIIDMLPDPADSLKVKKTKINAARKALVDRANAKALANGIPSPFGGTPLTVEVNATQPEATKTIGNQTYVKRGGLWYPAQ